MLIVLFVITLWNLILAILGKYDMSKAYCGLVGYCGNTPASDHIVKLLMLYNMERGEDSTGWVINNKVTKDTIKVSEFLSKNKPVFTAQDENYSFIAHARKSSSGARLNKDLAHPFGVCRNDIEKQTPDLVLAMNGTLTNTDAFAKEFNLTFSFANNSDTQILSKAMVNLGEKEFRTAIKRYSGTATLLFFNPKYPNTMMVWKDPERPLFMWQKTKNQIYISSMEESLSAAGAEEKDIFKFSDSHLYTITKGVIKSKEEIKKDPIKIATTYYSQDYEDFHGCGGSSTAYRQNKSSDNITISKIFDNQSEYHQKKGNKAYCLIDKYYRNGHPLDGKYYINQDGKIKNTENEAGFNSTYVLRYFIKGYLIQNEQLYNELNDKCSVDGNFSIDLFKDIYTSELCANYIKYPVITIVKAKRVWCVPKGFNDKIISVGDTRSYRPFLSDYEFTYKYMGKLSGKVDVKFCEDISVKKVKEESDLTDIKDKFSDKENETFIKKTISEMDAPHKLSCTFLTSSVFLDLWSKNTTYELKNYFYKDVLIPLFIEENVISGEAAESIIREATKTSWSHFKISDELDKCLKALKKRIEKEDKKEIEELSGLSTKEKIELLKNFNKNVSSAELVKSIEEANPFYESTLKTDFYNGDDFEEMLRNYLQDTSVSAEKDVYYFYECIALFLKDCGQIKESDLFAILDLSITEMISKIKTDYNYWQKETSDTTKKSDEDSEEEEDLEDERNTLEQDYENFMNDCVELMDQIISSGNALEDKLKTDRIKEIMEAMEEARKNLELKKTKVV